MSNDNICRPWGWHGYRDDWESTWLKTWETISMDNFTYISSHNKVIDVVHPLIHLLRRLLIVYRQPLHPNQCLHLILMESYPMNQILGVHWNVYLLRVPRHLCPFLTRHPLLHQHLHLLLHLHVTKELLLLNHTINQMDHSTWKYLNTNNMVRMMNIGHRLKQRNYKLQLHDPMKCPIYEKRFNLSRLLSRHLKCHSDIKRYLCTFCGKGFNGTVDLKSHTKTHTGNWVYHYIKKRREKRPFKRIERLLSLFGMIRAA